MQYKEICGDIVELFLNFTSSLDNRVALLNPCNCQHIMNIGLSNTIREKLPDFYRKDGRFYQKFDPVITHQAKNDLLGKTDVFIVNVNKVGINAYTKLYTYSNHADIKDVENCFNDILNTISCSVHDTLNQKTQLLLKTKAILIPKEIGLKDNEFKTLLENFSSSPILKENGTEIIIVENR